MSYPRSLGTPEQVAVQIEEYFAKAAKEKRPFTIMGLCNALGICRRTWHNYRHEQPDYTDILDAAKLRVEQWWEERLGSTAATGAIFWLKNNGGYKDLQQQEISGPDGGPVQYAQVQIVGVLPPQADDDQPMDADAL